MSTGCISGNVVLKVKVGSPIMTVIHGTNSRLSRVRRTEKYSFLLIFLNSYSSNCVLYVNVVKSPLVYRVTRASSEVFRYVFHIQYIFSG